MDKLYSKISLVIKAVFCFILAPLYALLSSLITVEDNFLFILLAIIPVASLYTVPFWFSLERFKRFRVKLIGKYILFDTITCLLPAVFGILVSEVLHALINGRTVADGIVTVIFATIFVLISVIFWLLYYIFSYKNRP
jgi:hypothetical protein